MIDFVYVVLILFYVLLIFSIIVKELYIGMISSIGIMAVGVYLFIYGVAGISSFLIDVIGSVSFGIGFYVFLRGSIEEIADTI